MKKIFAIALIIGALAFTSEKSYEIKMTEAEVNTALNTIVGVQGYVQKSNLPHQDVINIYQGLDSVKNIVLKQVRAQNQVPAKK